VRRQLDVARRGTLERRAVESIETVRCADPYIPVRGLGQTADLTDSNPVLLRVTMGGGHGGASGRYDAMRDYAFNLAFVLWQMGINN
jgi:hypothetical protein